MPNQHMVMQNIKKSHINETHFEKEHIWIYNYAIQGPAPGRGALADRLHKTNPMPALKWQFGISEWRSIWNANL